MICHKEYLERNGVFSTNARQYMFIFCILPELLYQVIQKKELQSNHHIISKDRNLWPIRIVIVIWYDVNMPSEISNICKELGYEVWHRFLFKEHGFNHKMIQQFKSKTLILNLYTVGLSIHFSWTYSKNDLCIWKNHWHYIRYLGFKCFKWNHFQLFDALE